jgi:hypothetical protein
MRATVTVVAIPVVAIVYTEPGGYFVGSAYPEGAVIAPIVSSVPVATVSIPVS